MTGENVRRNVRVFVAFLQRQISENFLQLEKIVFLNFFFGFAQFFSTIIMKESLSDRFEGRFSCCAFILETSKSKNGKKCKYRVSTILER